MTDLLALFTLAAFAIVGLLCALVGIAAEHRRWR